MPQVDPGAHDPRPVLDRRGHPVRGLRLRLAAAPALHRQHLVLGRHRLHRRDVDDLPALDRGDRRVLQGLPAAGALRRPVPHLLVRVLRSSIVAPGWPFGRPGLRPDLPRSDFGAGFASPSDDGGLLEFREFAFTWAARSATCDCSAVTSLAQHRVLRGLLPIRASRSASSSRSRVFAARSPPSPLSGTPGTSGTDERCHDSARPANRQTSKRPQQTRKRRRRKEGGQTGLSSYSTQSCSVHGTILAIRSRDRPPEFRKG